jgi:Gamma-glutamyl cyclotransferase, AIG2-like
MPLLFSYGTLQQEDVQRATFGRPLAGQPDELLGFVSALVEIEDAEVVATSGQRHHPIVKFTGATQDRVPGNVFEITDAELVQADQYEVSAYQRVRATLASGQRAWVYVDARFAPTIDSDHPRS